MAHQDNMPAATATHSLPRESLSACGDRVVADCLSVCEPRPSRPLLTGSERETGLHECVQGPTPLSARKRHDTANGNKYREPAITGESWENNNEKMEKQRRRVLQILFAACTSTVVVVLMCFFDNDSLFVMDGRDVFTQEHHAITFFYTKLWRQREAPVDHDDEVSIFYPSLRAAVRLWDGGVSPQNNTTHADKLHVMQQKQDRPQKRNSESAGNQTARIRRGSAGSLRLPDVSFLPKFFSHASQSSSSPRASSVPSSLMFSPDASSSYSPLSFAAGSGPDSPSLSVSPLSSSPKRFSSFTWPLPPLSEPSSISPLSSSSKPSFSSPRSSAPTRALPVTPARSAAPPGSSSSLLGPVAGGGEAPNGVREEGPGVVQEYRGTSAATQQTTLSDEGETPSDKERLYRQGHDENEGADDGRTELRLQVTGETQDGELQEDNRIENTEVEEEDPEGMPPGRRVADRGTTHEEKGTRERAPQGVDEGLRGASRVAAENEKGGREAQRERGHYEEGGDDENVGEAHDSSPQSTGEDERVKYERGGGKNDRQAVEREESETEEEGLQRVETDSEATGEPGVEVSGETEDNEPQTVEEEIPEGNVSTEEKAEQVTDNDISENTADDESGGQELGGQQGATHSEHGKGDRETPQSTDHSEEEEKKESKALPPVLENRVKGEKHHEGSRHHLTRLLPHFRMSPAEKSHAVGHVHSNVPQLPPTTVLSGEGDAGGEMETQSATSMGEAAGSVRRLTDVTGDQSDSDKKESRETSVSKEEAENKPMSESASILNIQTEYSTPPDGIPPSSLSSSSSPGISHVEEKTSNLLLLAWEACGVFTCGDGSVSAFLSFSCFSSFLASPCFVVGGTAYTTVSSFISCLLCAICGISGFLFLYSVSSPSSSSSGRLLYPANCRSLPPANELRCSSLSHRSAPLLDENTPRDSSEDRKETEVGRMSGHSREKTRVSNKGEKRDANLPPANGVEASQGYLRPGENEEPQFARGDTGKRRDDFSSESRAEHHRGLVCGVDEEGKTLDGIVVAPPCKNEVTSFTEEEEVPQQKRKSSQVKCTYTSLPSAAVLGTAEGKGGRPRGNKQDSQYRLRDESQAENLSRSRQLQINGDVKSSQQQRQRSPFLPPSLGSASTVLPYKGRGGGREGYIELAGEPSGDDYTGRHGKRTSRHSERRGRYPDESWSLRYSLEEDSGNTGKKLASWVYRIVTLTLLNVCNVTCMLIFEYILLRNVLAGSGQIRVYRQSLSLLLPAAAPRENFSSFSVEVGPATYGILVLVLLVLAQRLCLSALNNEKQRYPVVWVEDMHSPACCSYHVSPSGRCFSRPVSLSPRDRRKKPGKILK
ncbi:transmembrane protein [Cystoisospora suis]|uniref:Transmembrane protein n=1 Tax=Cystoisospora suis TaxID=483139 RepID=A0A2C6L1A2_9APIC|nr:transmembrane protein [Cystoisospora suis]